MNLNRIHLMREILVLDKRGRKIPTIQVSYSKPFDLKPVFCDVSKKDQKEARAFYEKMGGGRLKEWSVGITIILPN